MIYCEKLGDTDATEHVWRPYSGIAIALGTGGAESYEPVDWASDRYLENFGIPKINTDFSPHTVSCKIWTL